MGKEYESGKWGVISVEGICPLETKKLSQENDHLKRLLGEKDLEIATVALFLVSRASFTTCTLNSLEYFVRLNIHSYCPSY